MTITLERREQRASRSAARSKRDDAALAQAIRRDREEKERQALGWLRLINWFELSDGQRHGSFLALEESMQDARTLARWDEASRKAVAAVEADAAVPRESVYLQFPGSLPVDAHRELIAAGLSYRKSHDIYDGTLKFADAQMLADKYGGQVRRYAAGTPAPMSLIQAAE